MSGQLTSKIKIPKSQVELINLIFAELEITFHNQFWRPQSALRAAQERPKSAQERPKSAQERPKSAQEGPKRGQERPKRGPRAAKRGPRAAPKHPMSGKESEICVFLSLESRFKAYVS